MINSDALDQTPNKYIRELEIEDANEAAFSAIENALALLPEEIRQDVLNWCGEARNDLTKILPAWDELNAIIAAFPKAERILSEACPDYAEFTRMEPIEDENILQTEMKAKVAKVAKVDPGYLSFLLKKGA